MKTVPARLRRPMLVSALLVACGLAALPVAAQDKKANTILVLDGSGSMWGQIDGVNKITIAREVVADILKAFPADENLGLVAYGHRQRGQCSDIETLVAPAQGTAAKITQIVNGLNPRGMTPMTDAVIAAAQALRHTEQAATVILVSDGIETCHADPCAAARALEQAGVDFTTHVIGFDVKGEADAMSQMQCIAKETGGRFLTADNAQELGAALQQVVSAPSASRPAAEPEPPAAPPPPASLAAPEVAVAGSMLEVAWEGPDAERDNVLVARVGEPHASGFSYTRTGNPVRLQLPGEPGLYELRYQYGGSSGEILHVRPIELIEGKLSLLAPDSAPAGSVVEVRWSGPDAQRDNIQIAPVGGQDYSWTYTSRGNPARVQLPFDPGRYELRYEFMGGGAHGRVIHAVPIEVTPVEVSINAPASAAAGSTVEIGWTGPNAEKDNIQVARPGDRYIHWANTRSGNPVRLKMPDEPGMYELRYSFRDQQTVQTRTITVTPAP